MGLATCAALPVGDPDDAALVAALHARDLDVHWIPWSESDPLELADRIDLLVLRSTWDYTDRREDFLAWLDTAAVPVMNSPSLVRWNSDKRYLADLADAGVPTVPSSVLDSPDDAWTIPEGFEEFVVKPSVGAGSRGARRFKRADEAAARTHAQDLWAEGKTVLVQPYLPSVDEGSETALIHFDGVFSHSITKGPMLSRDGTAEMVDGLYVAENIDPRSATEEQRAVALQVLAALPDLVPDVRPLYARVDLIDDPDGRPVLLELEVVEPSLFFAFDPPAADRLAEAIHARL